MRGPIYLVATCALVLVTADVGRAESIWARRDPKTAYLFHDYRARLPGDTLTIVVTENTEFDAQESHNLAKQTQASAGAGASGKATAGSILARQFSGNLDVNNNSNRQLDGKANSTIDRKFADNLSVIVVGVLPNGNLVIEGYRQRIVNREVRTLKVAGVVRPADIGPYNTVQSQFIANFTVGYLGRGPDTNFTNQGWGGRLTNHLWPW